MVAIARYMNVTLIVPLFDNGTYWNDNRPREKAGIRSATLFIGPINYASLRYYNQWALPRILKRGVLRFPLTDSRLANNGLADEVQKLRCRANYEALRFTQPIEETGERIVSLLRQKGPFMVLHLGYEKDMVAFTGCTQGLTKQEIQEVTEMRYSYKGWKHRGIDPGSKRAHGACSLTPEETVLVLQALGVDRNTTVYIAAGKIYNEEKRMANLAMAYPNLIRKEHVLNASELRPFLHHNDQMAALDYIVAVESDIFMPTYGYGNMGRAVEGHRRYLGYKPTILLNRKLLVSLIDGYKKGTLSWDEFALLVKKTHENLTGKPARRRTAPDHPAFEDHFYSNPYECLPPFIH
ncbi:hypothetical protein PTKIN_Ptkin17bG0141500 [Pterospermum kingtungense]